MEAPAPRLLDELARRALRADETVEIDGWLLRSSPSLPFRRANAALPHPTPPHPTPLHPTAHDGIDRVEAFYRDRDQSPLVALPTGAEARSALDHALATRGWSLEAPVAVLWAPVAAVRARLDAAAGPSPNRLTIGHDPGAVLAASWLDDRARARLAAYERVLADHGGAGRTLTVLDQHGSALAVGHAVTLDGWTAVFGMLVDPARRRQGTARALLGAIVATPGTTGLWLQVELDNGPARRLYEAAGFLESHRTHYRRAPA